MNKITWLLILASTLSSCGIKKTTSNFSTFPKTPKELIKKVNSKKNDYKWVRIKGKARVIKKGQDVKLQVDIKNRRDSILWVSVTALFGIEIIRAQITPDSIYVINRTNDTYLIKPISYIKELINSDLSFYEIQDMITGNLKILKKDYKLEKAKTIIHLASDSTSYYISNNYKIQSAKLIDNDTSLEVAFNDYQEADNFPRRLTLKIIAEETFETTIQYLKVEFNKKQLTFFEIADSYNEIK